MGGENQRAGQGVPGQSAGASLDYPLRQPLTGPTLRVLELL
jgi:hypothetical protein